MLRIVFALSATLFLAACATQDQVYRYSPAPSSTRTCQTGGFGCG